MKKIILLFVSLAFIACSTDQNQEQDKMLIKEKSSKTLQELYDAYINSDSYKDYIVASKSFSSKINYSGDFSDFSDHTKLMNWISANISSTKFSNFEEAEKEFGELILKSEAVTKENNEFVNGNYTKKEFELIVIQVGEPPVNQTNSGCIGGCIDNYMTEMHAISDRWRDAWHAGRAIGGAMGEFVRAVGDLRSDVETAANLANYDSCACACSPIFCN